METVAVTGKKTKSTPARRAAKRDRAERLGKVEQTLMGLGRKAVAETKGILAERPNVGQVLLIALAAVLIASSGWVEGWIDGLLG